MGFVGDDVDHEWERDVYILIFSRTAAPPLRDGREAVNRSSALDCLPAIFCSSRSIPIELDVANVKE